MTEDEIRAEIARLQKQLDVNIQLQWNAQATRQKIKQISQALRQGKVSMGAAANESEY